MAKKSDRPDRLTALSRIPRPASSLPDSQPQFAAHVANEAIHAAMIDRDRGPGGSLSIGFLEATSRLHGLYQAQLDEQHSVAKQRLLVASSAQDTLRADVNAAHRERSLDPSAQQDAAMFGPFCDVLVRSTSESRAHAARARLSIDQLRRKVDAARIVRDRLARPLGRFEPLGTKEPRTALAAIAFSVVLEVAINAWFFLNSTANGFIGAIAEVLLFAPTNIGLAVFYGLFSLRFRSPRQPKVLRAIAAATYHLIPPAILALNIALAVARLSYSDATLDRLSLADGDQAPFLDVLRLLLSHQAWEIIDVYTLAIFGLGLGLAVFAGYKSYRLFDPEPGFTAVCRKYDDTLEAFDDGRNDYLRELQGRLRTDLDATEQLVDQYFRAAARCRVLQEMIDDECEHYDAITKVISSSYKAVISEFRIEYGRSLAIDQGALPPCEPLTVMPLTDPEHFNAERARLADVMRKVDMLKQEKQQVSARLNAAFLKNLDEAQSSIFVSGFPTAKSAPFVEGHSPSGS